ncbi:MAG: glycosyltransferase family A protein, partial [Candidatus Hydrogenedentales bacterium]
MHNRADTSISVLIPAYNAQATIEATLSSALNQTQPAAEIIVLDDGSKDRTAEMVAGFGQKVTLHRQQNTGVATARNVLLRLARHDLVAFLDSDDLWHPRYLEHQRHAVELHPNAVAYYTGFTSIHSAEEWSPKEEGAPENTLRLIDPKTILRRYQEASAFLLPSFTLFSKRALLDKFADGPFPADISTAEDSYLWYVLALSGPFVESAAKLGAYRLTAGSLSSDRVRAYRQRAAALEHLIDVYARFATLDMQRLAADALASMYRKYAKHLMGAGDTAGARRVLKKAWAAQHAWRTLALLVSTHFPASLQPAWPKI